MHVLHSPLGHFYYQYDGENANHGKPFTFLSSFSPYILVLYHSHVVQKWFWYASGSMHQIALECCLQSGFFSAMHHYMWLQYQVGLFYIFSYLIKQLYSLITCSLLLSDSPPQIHLIHVDEMFGGHCSELREHKSREKITLSVHVTECGGNKYTSCTPSETEREYPD